MLASGVVGAASNESVQNAAAKIFSGRAGDTVDMVPNVTPTAYHSQEQNSLPTV